LLTVTSLTSNQVVSTSISFFNEDSFSCASEATSLKNETEVFEHGFFISSSLKNETTYEDSFFVSVATSLKNET
jgi:hypothetical protein